MKKIITLTLLLNTFVFSNIHTIVSIAPIEKFVHAIGGKYLSTTLMVHQGDSPHTYEPKASQMIQVAKASLYFSIGVEFEEVWLPKFQSLNHSLKIVDLSRGVEKIAMQEEEHHHAHHDEDGLDPHIWTSPNNVKIIAQNIYDKLVSLDKLHQAYYKKNLETFLAHIEKTDKTIRAILASHSQHKKFMVFHPSWGYFAKTYQLEQIAIEIEGKSPKPRALIKLLKHAKKEKISAIFTQPEFSDVMAKIIAKELRIPVIKVSPLARDWALNLINIAKAIANEK